MTKMLKSHQAVLKALAEDEGYFFNFANLSFNAKMERKEVRRIVRHLARRGLTEFGKGLWTEDGEPAGSGYRITAAGIEALGPTT